MVVRGADQVDAVRPADRGDKGPSCFHSWLPARLCMVLEAKSEALRVLRPSMLRAAGCLSISFRFEERAVRVHMHHFVTLQAANVQNSHRSGIQVLSSSIMQVQLLNTVQVEQGEIVKLGDPTCQGLDTMQLHIHKSCINNQLIEG